MSCKQKKLQNVSLFVVIGYFYTFPRCCSVSLGQYEDDIIAYRVHDWKGLDQDGGVKQGKWHLVEHIIQSPNAFKLNQPGLDELLPEPGASHGEPPAHFSAPKLLKTGINFGLNSSSWTVGKVGTKSMSASTDSEDDYQGDFAGFHGVQGKISGLSSDTSPHFSEWQAIQPLVECGNNVMIFTASGQGVTYLQVDRVGDSPISVFHLPPYCGYSLKTSHRDLEMMVPYDACYIIQEYGSYVLPILWWGNPLKFSCPIWITAPAPMMSLSAPSVFCSPDSMVVQMHGQEKDIPVLGFKVSGAWGPFVSEKCASFVESRSQELTFLISYSASCITSEDGRHLQLVLDDQDYMLSCPPDTASPTPTPSAGDPQFPYIPYPDGLAPTTPLPPPFQIPHLPDYPYYPFPALSQYPQPHQVHLPALKPTRPPQSTHGTPSGQQQQLFLHPTDIKYPFAISPATQPPKPPKSRYYPQYHPQIPYYPQPTVAPVIQQPVPLPPRPQSPVDPQYRVDPLYPRNSFSSYYPHWPIYYPKPSTGSPASEFHPQGSIYLPLPVVQPSAKGGPQKPVVPQAISVPLYYPNHLTVSPSQYHPPYLPVPQYQQITPAMTTQKPTTTTMTPPTTTTAWPNPQDPHLQCLIEKMAVFLPYAHPESIQLREQKKAWVLLSSVSPHCGYMLQMPQDFGVILHAPLPACHSQLQTPTTVSLPIRFWDLSIAQYRTLDPQCPYPSTPKTPAPVTSPISTNLPTTTKSSVVPKPKVFCSPHQMNVELPAGPISGIAIKDISRHQVTLQEAPTHCGYSASKGKDGKIHLILQLHSVCHMSVEDNMYTITVIYMTANGRKEAQFSCPVVIPVSGQECNLPSEQHLPCGSSSVSQPQCLSMGCCFNKDPPACYYPMDECTIDRHFVFSVPAFLTEPPLSPALLVAATNSTCKPQRVISSYALFKIPMDSCGARRVMVGKTVVYMVEVINKVHTLSLNYGTITRDSPIRLLVECRLAPESPLTVGYMVKTPTISPEVQSQGVFGVQLRIAEDAQYSTYYPQYHQPLQMLLGKPLYLEVRLLNSPDPSLVLLVHYCVAYPRSGKAVWVLLYNGCPNPLDPALPQTLTSDPPPSNPKSQTRRFTITTFQFLPDGEFKDPEEEIYFMCSTEICSPRDGPCVEGCFGQ